LNPNLDPDIQDLMNAMLDRNPKTRIDINGVLNHKTMTKYKSSIEEPISSDDFKILIRNYLINCPQKLTSEAPEGILNFAHVDPLDEKWINLQDFLKNTGPIFGKTFQASKKNNESKPPNNFNPWIKRSPTDSLMKSTPDTSVGDLPPIPSNAFIKSNENSNKKVIKIDNSYDFWKTNAHPHSNANQQIEVASSHQHQPIHTIQTTAKLPQFIQNPPENRISLNQSSQYQKQDKLPNDISLRSNPQEKLESKQNNQKFNYESIKLNPRETQSLYVPIHDSYSNKNDYQMKSDQIYGVNRYNNQTNQSENIEIKKQDNSNNGIKVIKLDRYHETFGGNNWNKPVEEIQNKIDVGRERINHSIDKKQEPEKRNVSLNQDIIKRNGGIVARSISQSLFNKQSQFVNEHDNKKVIPNSVNPIRYNTEKHNQFSYKEFGKVEDKSNDNNKGFTVNRFESSQNYSSHLSTNSINQSTYEPKSTYERNPTYQRVSLYSSTNSNNVRNEQIVDMSQGGGKSYKINLQTTGYDFKHDQPKTSFNFISNNPHEKMSPKIINRSHVDSFKDQKTLNDSSAKFIPKSNYSKHFKI